MTHSTKVILRALWVTTIIVLASLLLMWVGNLLLSIALPIFLSFLFYYATKPSISWLMQKGMKRMFAVNLIYFLFVAILLTFLALTGFFFVVQIQHLLDLLPSFLSSFNKDVMKIIFDLQAKYDALSPLNEEALRSKLTEYSAKGVTILTAFAWKILSMFSSVGSFLLNLIFAFILAYFLSSVIGTWEKNFQHAIPRTFRNIFSFLQTRVVRAIVAYVRSISILILITFTLLFLSFLLIGIDNAFSIALLAAFFDVLPILGVSTIMIPWIVYTFFFGNTTTAILLTIVWVVVMGTRNFLEPKILGDSLGVNAFVMFSAMIVSLNIFGVSGIILSPILIILGKSLLEEGIIKRWYGFPDSEYGE